MMLRRTFLALLALLAAAGVALLLARALAPGGWGAPKLLILMSFLGVAPWLGLGVGNALLGFGILVAHPSPARFVLPVPRAPGRGPVSMTIAIAVTVRNESMALVLPPLRRLFDGLDHAGTTDRIGLFVLSDTQDPKLAAAEQDAVAAFRAADRDPARIRYRRRAGNDGFKAGNVMDFLDHLADEFEVAVMLDADSQMSPGAVLQLLRVLEAAPGLGLVQHLTVGLPAAAALPRLFQFGMRAGMRVWATGQAFWQGDAGPYWGHNAAFRIAPFRAHCRLEPLPDGRPILSHDQVEAARLRAAGWGVCVLAEEDGSYEANPPALPEFLRRDARWLAGNLQYRHLLFRPGLTAMGRWQLLQAILLFAGAPFQVAMLALTAVSVALGGGAAVPQGRTAALAAAWAAAHYAPKLLGYAEVLVSARARARYGGGARFALGAAVEIPFSLLLDAPVQFHRALGMLRLARGAPAGWAAQNRAARGVTWGEAARLLWPHTGFGLAAFAALAAGGMGAVLWALPFAGGLLTAIPFCVLSADPRLGAWLAARGVAATPEELYPPTDSYFASRQEAGSAAAASYQAATSGNARTAAQ